MNRTQKSQKAIRAEIRRDLDHIAYQISCLAKMENPGDSLAAMDLYMQLCEDQMHLAEILHFLDQQARR
jgi:hypothetical protein